MNLEMSGHPETHKPGCRDAEKGIRYLLKRHRWELSAEELGRKLMGQHLWLSTCR